MKKAFILTLLFIISMVFFVSCQKESVVNQHTINENVIMESSTTKSHFDQSVLIKALGEDYNFQGYDKLNEHEKSAIIAQAQDDGLTVSFEGNIMIVADEEGNTVRFGAEESENNKSDISCVAFQLRESAVYRLMCLPSSDSRISGVSSLMIKPMLSFGSSGVSCSPGPFGELCTTGISFVTISIPFPVRSVSPMLSLETVTVGSGIRL